MTMEGQSGQAGAPGGQRRGRAGAFRPDWPVFVAAAARREEVR